MKNEYIYECINDWRDALLNNKNTDRIAMDMGNFLLSLKEEMKINEAKKAGKSQILSGAKSIIKNAKKNPREILHGMFPNETSDGTVWCVCDAYRAVRFKDELPLEKAEDTTGAGWFDLRKIMVRPYNSKKIESPDLTEFKLFARTHKSDRYQIDKELDIWVNSNYLMDMLKCLPNAKVYVVGQLSPIYFEADNGDGILLPVRPKR